MRVVFFGTSEFAVPALTALHAAGFPIAAAVTTQEKPKGRGLTLQPSPVKVAAEQLGIAVLEPENPNTPEFVAQLRGLRADVVVLAAYRFILKPELLAFPPRGCVNIHPSLLPMYRGAAPIPRALMAGEKTTGVSIFLMNEKIDQGDVILQESVDIGIDEAGGELSRRLAETGARLAIEGLRRIESGDMTRIAQSGPGSYAPKIAKEERVIDWRQPARRVHNLVRALSPSPAAYTLLRGKRLEILASELAPDQTGAPGEVAIAGRQVLCAAQDGSIRLLRVKPEGGKLMTGIDLVNGKRIAAGDRLGEL
jgi:methionyl-tRNA formyltransferase